MTNQKDKIPLQYMDQIQELMRKTKNGIYNPKIVSECLRSVLVNLENFNPESIKKQQLSDNTIEFDEVIAVFEGVEFRRSDMNYRKRCKGQWLKYHLNGGGLVPADQDEFDETKPFIEDTVYVGPFATIQGNIRIFGDVRITGSACITGDSQATSDVLISDNSCIGKKACVVNGA